MIAIEDNFLVRNVTVSPLGGIRIASFCKNSIGILASQRVLPHYTLVYVIGGNGSYRDENEVQCDIGPGDTILVVPGLRHWYGPPKGKRWDEIYVIFEGPIFDLWKQEGCLDVTRPVVSLHPLKYWFDRIKLACGENNESDPHRMMQEVLRMQALLLDIQRASRGDGDSELLWLQSAKRAIEEHGSPQRAARALNTGYEAFRKRFRRLAGIPPGKYRTALLMERACEMLAQADLTVCVIAEQLGYCDEYHFSKQFSKTIGWSPREYRARVALT